MPEQARATQSGGRFRRWPLASGGSGLLRCGEARATVPRSRTTHSLEVFIMPRSTGYNRRDFTRAALTGAAAVSMPTVARAGRVIGANDRVRLGCIGLGYRGVQVLNAFGAQKDAQVVALCDVYEPYLNGRFDKIDPYFKKLGYVVPKALPEFGGPVQRHKDFRRVLDDKDLDAVIIAAPDHWHALMTTMACDAGKDVYIEKPLSFTVKEGRRMVEAARRNDRVVQVGTQTAVIKALCATGPGGAVGRDRQGDYGQGRPDRQHVSRRNRQGARLGSAPGPGLGAVAGASPRAAVQPQHPALQVPLVERLLVADGQLGSALLRRDPLDRRRDGTERRHGRRRRLCSGRLPHDPRHGRGDLRARLGHAHHLQHVRGQRPTPASHRRDRAAGNQGNHLCRHEPFRDRSRAGRAVPGQEAALPAASRPEPRRLQRARRRPRPQLPRLHQVAPEAELRRRGRPPLDHLRPAGQHRPGHQVPPNWDAKAECFIDNTPPMRCSITSTASRGRTGGS